MRVNRLLRLVLAAAVVAAVGVLAFHPHSERPADVDWTYADETNPIYPPESPTPETGGQNGDGEPDDETESPGTGPDGGDAGEPSVSPPAGSGDGDNAAGGMLGLSFPAQAGLSLGVLALAFLALLPGRRMPARLR